MDRTTRWIGLLALVVAAAPARAQAPAAVGQSTAAPRPRQSWTADRRAFGVGDVITVLIDEYTLAAANKGNFASDRRSRDASLAVGQNVTLALPTSVGADIGTSNDAESRQRGEATRQNRFQGEMTVRIVGVEPGGMLRVEGTKLVNVDKNRQELTLRGWLRPQDVSPQNLVDSWRLGDVELVYSAKGSLGRPAGGIVSRVLGAIWP